jgi:hypothetical protein
MGYLEEGEFQEVFLGDFVYLEDALVEKCILDVGAVDLDSLKIAEDMRRGVEAGLVARFLENMGSF